MFISCRKKASESSGPVSFQHITEWASYMDDALYHKEVFHYSGSNVSEIVCYSSGIVKQAKHLVTNNKNQISALTSYDTTGRTWYKLAETEVTQYNGSSPAEVITHEYDGSGYETGRFKIIFTYNGTLLAGKINYKYSSGSWTEINVYQYTYDNSSRIIRMSYQSPASNYSYNYTYLYQGNTLTTELDSTTLSGNMQITKWNAIM